MIRKPLLNSCLVAALLVGGCTKSNSGGTPCGEMICELDETCCGPPECGYCIPENSGAYCASTCPGPEQTCGPTKPAGECAEGTASCLFEELLCQCFIRDLCYASWTSASAP